VKFVSRYTVQATGHTRLLWAKLPELTQDLCVQSADRSFHGQISVFSRTTGGFRSDHWHLQQRGRYQRGSCRSDLASSGYGDGPVSPYLRRGLTSRVGSGETGVGTREESLP
jgi:hypothetical protein